MRSLVQWQKQEYTGMNPGLGRIKSFLKLTGDPQEQYPVVHIAGTNGKGSTARMLSLMFEKSGLRTGLYVSPHLVRITERIQINSREIGNSQLDALANKYSAIAEQCGLTFFEFMSAVAFHYFAENKVDIAVLETGLGGRFDATNVIRQPLASIITDVDYDHRAFLGSRLAAIAGEKAGIIKRGCPVISGVERPSAAAVVRATAHKRNAPLLEINRDFTWKKRKEYWSNGYQKFTYGGINGNVGAQLSLAGLHQIKNCSLALAAVELLQQRGVGVSMPAAKRALATVTWPGRFDVLMPRRKEMPGTVVIDGAHNPGAVRRFRETWKESPYGRKKMTLIFGVLKDKDYAAIIRMLSRVVGKVILVEVQSPRALGRDAMRREWRKYLPDRAVMAADSIAAALKASQDAAVVAIAGSLYMAGEALSILRK